MHRQVISLRPLRARDVGSPENVVEKSARTVELEWEILVLCHAWAEERCASSLWAIRTKVGLGCDVSCNFDTSDHPRILKPSFEVWRDVFSEYQ